MPAGAARRTATAYDIANQSAEKRAADLEAFKRPEELHAEPGELVKDADAMKRFGEHHGRLGISMANEAEEVLSVSPRAAREFRWSLKDGATLGDQRHGAPSQALDSSAGRLRRVAAKEVERFMLRRDERRVEYLASGRSMHTESVHLSV